MSAISAVQHTPPVAPVAQAAPVQPVARDSDGDNDGSKPQAANPAGVGTQVDITA